MIVPPMGLKTIYFIVYYIIKQVGIMDLDLDNLPKVTRPSEKVVEACVSRAARYYQINPMILLAVRNHEAGQVGMANKNSNGSYDMGVMQLNTINLSLIQENFPKITAKDIIFKPCVNVFIGAWFLKSKIDGAGGDVWKGIGNYHSYTKKYHDIYVAKVVKQYKKIRNKYLSPQPKAQPKKTPTVIGIYRD